MARQSESGHRDDNWFGGTDLVPPGRKIRSTPSGRAPAFVGVGLGFIG